MANVLMIAPNTDVKGGISTVVLSILHSKLSIDNKFWIVSTHTDGNRLYKAYVAMSGVLKSLLILKNKQIDVVHIHGSDIISTTRKSLFFRIAKIFHKKIIYHFHGAFFYEQYIGGPWFIKKNARSVFEKSDHVVCLSESWKEIIGNIAPTAKITVIPNAVEVTVDRKTYDKKNRSQFNIVFLGKIGQRKGVFDLIKCVKNLKEQGIKIKLYIGGNGDVGKLHKEVEEKKLGDVVSYLGWISRRQRDELFCITDLFVLPSYAEGMPMSILEAMAFGLPVIATSVGGVPELVDDGETGLLFEPGNILDMELKIKKIYEDELLRNKMGNAGYNKVKQLHSIENYIYKIDALYKEVIATS